MHHAALLLLQLVLDLVDLLAGSDQVCLQLHFSLSQP